MEKKQAKDTKTIEVSQECFNQITQIAKALKMPKKAFVGELINNVFDIASQFGTLNIQYSGLFTQAWLKMNFSGRRNIIFGAGSEKGVEEALKSLERRKP